jgi:hypothetical protein
VFQTRNINDVIMCCVVGRSLGAKAEATHSGKAEASHSGGVINVDDAEDEVVGPEGEDGGEAVPGVGSEPQDGGNDEVGGMEKSGSLEGSGGAPEESGDAGGSGADDGGVDGSGAASGGNEDDGGGGGDGSEEDDGSDKEGEGDGKRSDSDEEDAKKKKREEESEDEVNPDSPGKCVPDFFKMERNKRRSIWMMTTQSYKSTHHDLFLSLNLVWSIEYQRSNQTRHGVSEIVDTETSCKQE